MGFFNKHEGGAERKGAGMSLERAMKLGLIALTVAGLSYACESGGGDSHEDMAARNKRTYAMLHPELQGQALEDAYAQRMQSADETFKNWKGRSFGVKEGHVVETTAETAGGGAE